MQQSNEYNEQGILVSSSLAGRTQQCVETRVATLVVNLNRIEIRKHLGNGYTHPADVVKAATRRKFIAIDIGTSGAWLVERDTGEIFNIKGYGVADRNKKAKSDIGNVATVDPERMHSMRYNYLR